MVHHSGCATMVHDRAAADNFSDNIHDIHSRWQADFFFKLVRIPFLLHWVSHGQ